MFAWRKGRELASRGHHGRIHISPHSICNLWLADLALFGNDKLHEYPAIRGVLRQDYCVGNSGNGGSSYGVPV